MIDTYMPYLRPEEDPEEFAEFAENVRLFYQPDEPETEALVECLTNTAWRLRRYRTDLAGLTADPEIPGHAEAIVWLADLVESLESVYRAQRATLEFWPRLHLVDVSEVTDSDAPYEELASFRQKYRDARAQWAGVVDTPSTLVN